MTEWIRPSLLPPADAPEITIVGISDAYTAQLIVVDAADALYHYQLMLSAEEPVVPTPLTLTWRIPAHGVQGMWNTDALYEKRLRADWEKGSVRSQIAANAPVICLFGHEDNNVQTFACSDAVSPMLMKAVVREEDSSIYCQMTFFAENPPLLTEYAATLRLDLRPVSFSQCLQDVTSWWASMDTLQPLQCTKDACHPVYSTWYSYHQQLSTKALLAECRAATPMGYKTIIIDDGWQTLDSNRGYDFTGDWLPERIPDMAAFVQQVHNQGMKCMLWYSVPFVGRQSRAFKRFQGKLLTQTHRWAPVLDPRFPEVRSYLIATYVTALETWNLDGFKLDFIDDFRIYADTECSATEGRDYRSVAEAVDRLMTDIVIALKTIKPNLMIEFRQRYIGPAMRKYGNMFRAFDCPNDAVTNRVRTTDVKLLCGDTAVHSDMVTWHYEEPVDMAALQLLNVLFSVPQLSIRLCEVPTSHREMVHAFTQYWLANRDLLLSGHFSAQQPLANYPILEAYTEEKLIVGLYQDMTYSLHRDVGAIDVVNAKRTRRVVLDAQTNLGSYQGTVFDCFGKQVERSSFALEEGLHAFYVPLSGRIELRRIRLP